MTYYKAHYGTWRHEGIVRRLVESYDRREVFEAAQDFANKNKTEVTIIAETGSASGLKIKTYKISPAE